MCQHLMSGTKTESRHQRRCDAKRGNDPKDSGLRSKIANQAAGSATTVFKSGFEGPSHMIGLVTR